TDRNLNALLLFWMANLSIEHGNCDASCLGYVQLMMALGPRFDDYSSGARFGQLGFDLMESRGLTGFRARVQLVFGFHVVAWTQHLRLARSLVRQALDTAHATGDLTFAAYASVLSVATQLASGTPLADVQRETEQGIAFARNARFDAVVAALDVQLALIR